MDYLAACELMYCEDRERFKVIAAEASLLEARISLKTAEMAIDAAKATGRSLDWLVSLAR